MDLSHWSQSGTFSNQSLIDCVHTVDEIHRGVKFHVRFVGKMPVTTSMKSHDFAFRSILAKECIIRVCEAANYISANRRRNRDKKFANYLGKLPNMDHSGTDVYFQVSTRGFSLSDFKNENPIAQHSMPNISFASGGDQETADFVSYVAKDNVLYSTNEIANVQRYCYVLECQAGMAQQVIATIGFAFKLRYDEFLRKAHVTNGVAGLSENAPQLQQSNAKNREYYNEPSLGCSDASLFPDTRSGQLNHSAAASKPIPAQRARYNGTMPMHQSDHSSPVLIDLNNSCSPPSSMGMNSYMNGASHNSSLSGLDSSDQLSSAASDAAYKNEQLLQLEDWYHGAISRAEAENRVKNDGEFLVRRSNKDGCQFVLTGIQTGSIKHLLLIDSEGIVRTKDRSFDSITHLIKYHRENSLPITSQESAILLRCPVHRSCQQMMSNAATCANTLSQTVTDL